MVKKKVKKKISVKTPNKPQKIIVQHAPSQEPPLDKILIENFVSLQRVLTNLAVNVDNLSNRISKLLDLFEISAKALAEKDFDMQEENTELKEKLDNLIDQNKILARGMALMHERIPREQFPPPVPIPQPQTGPPLRPPTFAPKPKLGYTQELSQESSPPPVLKPPVGPKNLPNFEPSLE